MSCRREDSALRSATGLEGGLVGCGSTCGVVSCGALGIALMRMGEVDADGDSARRRVMNEVREYVNWFRESFGTTLCRERSGVDFYRVSGQLRYLLPGDRVARCMWHMGKATSYLSQHRTPPRIRAGNMEEHPLHKARHCAAEVLSGVRASCGIGDTMLEEISIVLDGGVGCTGGVCGAVAGAVMAVNLAFGWDIRSMGTPETALEFLKGHVNLLKRKRSPSRETFSIGKELIGRLRESLPSLECARIAGRTFSGWDDFQSHMRSSAACRNIVHRAADIASEIISSHRHL